jgi:dihydroflavonol-4-reductase
VAATITGGMSRSEENGETHRVLITGATGFLGRHVVRACLNDGLAVRVFHRSSSDLSALENLPIEKAQGDITDRIAVKQALKECQGLFHVAGMVSYNPADHNAMTKTNVYGTRAVVAAALECNIKKVVYTSTSGVLPGTLYQELSDDENAVFDPRGQCAYNESKYLAEVEVYKAAARGLPAVIVNPSQVDGPGSLRLKPLFLADIVPLIDTGVNHVDVRDVAAGHVAAYRKGKVGERYILGHAEGNLTIAEFFDIVEQIRGKKVRRIKVAKNLLQKVLDNFETVHGKLFRKPLPIPITSDLILAISRYRFVNPSKAIKDLDLPQRPLQETFRETIAWLERATN